MKSVHELNQEELEEIKVIEVPISNAGFLEKFCVKERNERYFIAFETDVSKPYSILLKDLDWLKKVYGNKDGMITSESLNGGRKNEIATLELAIKANVPVWELGNVGPDGSININPKTGKPLTVYKLSNNGKENFQKNIDKGLLVLCKYVD